MPLDISQYATIIFDCDGVVLNSNRIKTEAFRSVALPYGKKAADRLVAYHVAHGGISRYVKFRYFVEQILPECGMEALLDGHTPTLDGLLADFARMVRSGLMQCDVAQELTRLRELSGKSRWLIVSGSDQKELREIFAARKLDDLFDGGIFGSPDTKHEIIRREMGAKKNITQSLYLGDSQLDHEVASSFDMAFVFISGWSEFKEWCEYCSVRDIPVRRALSSLVADLSAK